MSRRRRLILLALIVVLLLAASATAELAFGGLPLPQPPAGTAWVLRQYVSNGADVSLPSGRAPTLYIQPLGHKLSGSAGCNSYFSSYHSFFPGRLSISNLGQTLVYCQPASIDEFETRYLSDLPKVDSYRLDGSDLVLSGDGGHLTMRFIPRSARSVDTLANIEGGEEEEAASQGAAHGRCDGGSFVCAGTLGSSGDRGRGVPRDWAR